MTVTVTYCPHCGAEIDRDPGGCPDVLFRQWSLENARFETFQETVDRTVREWSLANARFREAAIVAHLRARHPFRWLLRYRRLAHA